VPQPSGPELELAVPPGDRDRRGGARSSPALGTSHPLTYQTLYRKYRSQTFADLIGQDATSRALQGAVASDRIAHAYLFSGTRGTGKTSSARLLAKAINCQRRAPGQSEPCNQCEWCQQLAAGSALDLIEIDAASNRGIDEIRDLREKVNLAPALGRWKIYIIDEAHMLTADAFNALLKTLEEPPEHVVFVLCTTEAVKIPATVLGRCQQFVFRRLSEEQMSRRLADIAQQEGFEVDPAALAVITRSAQGSMRDAIGLMDQLVPLSDGRISLDLARELLGLADPAQLAGLLQRVLQGDASGALAELGRIYEAGAELRQVVRGLMEQSRDRLVEAMDRGDVGARAELSALLESLLTLDGEIRRHAEPRLLFEATLVRAAVASAAALPAAAVNSPPAAVPAPPTSSPAPLAAAGPAPTPAGPAAPAPRAVPAVPAAAAPTPAPTPAPALAPPPAPSPAPVPPQAGSGDPGPDPLAAGWRAVLDQLGPKVRAFFVDARPVLEDGVLVLYFRFAFHHKMASENRVQIEPLVAAWLGPGTSIEVRLQEAAVGVRGPQEERPPAPEEDPLVIEAVRKFEGRVTRVREKNT